jgi:AraC family transcriptional regulator
VLDYIDTHLGEELFQRLFDKLFWWAGPRNLINFPETQVMIVYHDHGPGPDGKITLDICATVKPL